MISAGLENVSTPPSPAKPAIVAKYSDGSTENLKATEDGISYTGLLPHNGRVIKSLRFAYEIDQNGKLQSTEIEE